MKVLVGIVASALIIAAGAVLFVFSGAYNVAATDLHVGLTKWMFHETMHRSVKARAGSVNAPAQFSEREIMAGFSDFNEMCVTCHGAPGKERSEIGKGLNPRPPSLVRVTDHWSNGEIFWILKNGIKMTGMPAFGPTHDDERIWAIVAFLTKLSDLTPERYAEMESNQKSKSDRAHGDHGSEQKH
jgi:mono/diheme cytochrome c family protein